jgi:hypothetical protein
MFIFSNQLFAQRKVKQMDSDKQAQEDEAKNYDKKPWREKVSFGGNIGAAFSSGYSQFLLQPMVFYKITDKSIAGAGVTYIYWSQKYILNNGSTTVSDNVYGLNFLMRQLLFGPVYAQVEYVPINFTSYNYFGNSKRVWSNSLYVGGGYQQMSGRTGYYISILYDVLWKESYPNPIDPNQYNTTFYPSPVRFSVGFMF